MKHMRWLVLSLLLVTAFLLVACGGSDDETAGENTAEATAETVVETATDVPAPITGSGDVVEIRWYVGLGAGTDAPVITAQEAVVAEFNASHDNIELVLEIVDNTQAYDVLNTQIAAGNAPDIVGPTGIRGFGTFPGAFLDINPLITSTGFDMSDYRSCPGRFLDHRRLAGRSALCCLPLVHLVQQGPL